MDYNESVEWISGLRRYGIKLGLDRFEEMLRIAGNPHLNLNVIHIAGTNGKGSTSTMIATALQKAGYKVGLYLSPYVFDLRERIQINGQLIPHEHFADFVTRARNIVEGVEKTEYGQATEFEVKTLIGFQYFTEENVDYAAVEVGLGGRLDATNVVQSRVSVITNVFMDHMDRLGDTLSAIAFEKAGIIKKNTPVVCGALEPDALAVVRKIADERNAPLMLSCPDAFQTETAEDCVRYRSHPDHEHFDLLGHGWSIEDLNPLLNGEFQAANASCAAGALVQLRRQGVEIEDSQIREGIENAWLPGRLQEISSRPLVLADGAHNPAAAREVARFLSQKFSGKPIALVVGMMTSHEPDELLQHLAPVANWIVATQTGEVGTRSAEDIVKRAKQYDVDVRMADDVNTAIEQAGVLTGPDGIVCVTGSFYLIGKIRRPVRSSILKHV